MNLREFAEFHLPALEADEIRFNVQIAVITAAVNEPPLGFLHWTLGTPGHCATKNLAEHDPRNAAALEQPF
jgi:hypothetical protein